MSWSFSWSRACFLSLFLTFLFSFLNSHLRFLVQTMTRKAHIYLHLSNYIPLISTKTAFCAVAVRHKICISNSRVITGEQNPYYPANNRGAASSVFLAHSLWFIFAVTIRPVKVLRGPRNAYHATGSRLCDNVRVTIHSVSETVGVGSGDL